jgi:hypothetical protein
MTEQNDKLKAAALAERFRVYSRTTGMNMPISNAEAELIIEVLRKFDQVQSAANNSAASAEIFFANAKAWELRHGQHLRRAFDALAIGFLMVCLALNGLLP